MRVRERVRKKERDLTKESGSGLEGCNQCDQMTELFGQYLVIYYHDNLPNCIKFVQSGFKILPHTKYPSKIAKEF